MAHVEKRQRRQADGTLGPVRYRVRWRDDAGRARTKTFTKRRDADAWRTKVEHDLLSGAYIDQAAGKVTLRSYAEEWRKTQPWADSTAERTEQRLRDHVYPTFGARPIGSIRPSEVQAWAVGLTKGDRTLAASSAQIVVANLSSVLASAVTDRLITANPCQDLKLPKATKAPVVPPTVDQVELLLEHVDPEWFAFVQVLAGLGLRVSEALGLTVDRVDFLGRSVRIDQQVTQPRGASPRLTDRLKTEASYRTIPLPEVTSLALAAHLERRSPGDHGLIFHRAGRPWTRQTARAKLHAAAHAANRATPKGGAAPFLVMFHPHDLRHFYASMLIEAGCSVKVVQARLGHGTASITMDTYGHLWPDNEEQTRSAVDAVLGRASRTRPGRASL